MGRQNFLDEFQKEFKKEGIHINSASDLENIESIPTGIVSFDCSSGIGGFPKGRIVEVFGPESGGKSLLSLVSLAYAQKMFGSTGLYFDIEGGTPKEWLETLGIDLNLLDIVPAGLTAEQNFDTIVNAIEAEAYEYIIIDSVAGLVPRAELEGSITKDYMATLARVMGKGMKKVVATLGVAKKSPCLIFINQIREKPGVMFGDPTVTPGGRSLKFYAAQRYRVSKKSQSEEKNSSGDVIGHTIKVVNVKNKLGSPKREAEFFINYTQGVDTTSSLMTMLKERKAYEKKGQKYILTLFDTPIEFDKMGDIKQKIQDDKEFQLKIYNVLMKKWLGTLPGELSKTTEEDDEFNVGAD
jgi:recombination protein RecA